MTTQRTTRRTLPTGPLYCGPALLFFVELVVVEVDPDPAAVLPEALVIVGDDAGGLDPMEAVEIGPALVEVEPNPGPAAVLTEAFDIADDDAGGLDPKEAVEVGPALVEVEAGPDPAAVLPEALDIVEEPFEVDPALARLELDDKAAGLHWQVRPEMAFDPL